MQLKEIKSLLDSTLPNLVIERGADVNRAGATYWSINNSNLLRNLISLIGSTGLFQETYRVLKSSDLFIVGGEPLFLDPNAGRRIEEKINYLRTLAQDFSNILGPLVGETDPYTINIRLPHIKDFQDLADTSEDLQKIIAQVVINDEINGDVKIVSVENGSILFAVSVGSAFAVRLIAHIVNAATRIHTTILNNRILASRAEIAKIDADRHKFLVEQEKKLLSLYLDIETETIKNEFFKNPDGEISGRIKNSLKLLNSLMEKDVEIKPAISVSEEVKKEFPSSLEIKHLDQQRHFLAGQKEIANTGESDIDNNLSKPNDQ